MRVHIVLPGSSPETSFGDNAMPHLRGLDNPDYKPLIEGHDRSFPRRTQAQLRAQQMLRQRFGVQRPIQTRRLKFQRATTPCSGWPRPVNQRPNARRPVAFMTQIQPAADWCGFAASGVDNHRHTPTAALRRSLLCRRRGAAPITYNPDWIGVDIPSGTPVADTQ